MNPLLVAAIDFGTTYSGWAFSFKHEFDRDPTQVTAKNWNADTFISPKAPTCVLIKPDGKTFHSFGYNAESSYAELVAEKKHEKWFFFSRFKMMLFDKLKLKRDIRLEDVLGKKLQAKRVFALVIKYLKDDLMEECNKQLADEIRDKDIRWVLTVPAIWNDVAKQFMREAALGAGILKDQLVIALEPEAASIFCRHLPVEKTKGASASLAAMRQGTKYLVLDAGGGTVDITMHEVIEGGNLRELHKASGGDWGGTRVDAEYEKFVASIVGSDVIDAFKAKHPDDYMDLFRGFEVKKRDIPKDNKSLVTIRIPPSLNDLLKERTGKDFSGMLARSEFEGTLKYVSGKLRINAKRLHGLFEGTITNIVEHMESILTEGQCKGFSAILMVGGFSECHILQDAMRISFPGMKVIIPDNAGMVVLKGAVIFGHRPTAIIERICRYTYGLKRTHRTSERNCYHPPTKTSVGEDGVMRCEDIFCIHIRSGQRVKIGDEQRVERSRPRYDDQTAVGFTVYASATRDPILTTEEGCFKLGSLTLPIEDTSLGRKREFNTSFTFGGTEIVVKAVDKISDNISFLSIDCLD